ncbi:MAG TPA: hypothetical protein PK855_02265 [Bacteroidales bacterium]|nr:hypothetical protein [Bacteroidales bacterium]
MSHFRYHTIFILIVTIAANLSIYASDTTSVVNSSRFSLSLKADVVSRYVWRGKMLDTHPQFQPQLEFSTGNFTAGVWGSQSLTSTYGEVDLFVSYSIKNVSLTVFDYFYMDEEQLELSKFFDYHMRDSIPSCHTLDATMEWKEIYGTGFSFIASVFFYGDDHDEDLKRRYTNYIGMDYGTSFDNLDLTFSLGGSLSKGFYSDAAAITNISLKTSRTIPVHETFPLNLSGTITFNPKAQNLFFTLGFGI